MLDRNELKLFIENHQHLVSRKESLTYPGLWTLKYKNKVFYKNLWGAHPLLKECRGLVVDGDYNVVSYPFTKVFNYKENGTVIPLNEPVRAARKINGFLGVVTRTDRWGKVYSTTGSTDSDFALLAKRHIEPYVDLFEYGLTYMFEIVDPSDPHIIREEPGPYLIGVRYGNGEMMNLNSLQLLGKAYDLPVPKAELIQFGCLLDRMKSDTHEGYVVYGKEVTLKLKTEHYLVAKWLGRMKEGKLRPLLLEDLDTWIDEDFQFVLDELRKDPYTFVDMDEQDRIDYIHYIIERERS